jgi:hypothetical protein
MQKFSRLGVMLLVTVVAIITSIVVANATQTITTPNAAFVSFSLAPSANSATIMPTASRAVLVMGCTTSSGGNKGVGQVSLLHIPSTGIEWVGLESPSTAAITQGFTATPTAHIVFIDVTHKVDIRVAHADTILIHNGTASTEAGNVTLIW